MKKFCFFIMPLILLASCDYTHSSAREGGFYKVFVAPMDKTLDFLASHLNDNYGLAIIIVVVVIRLIFLPFIAFNYKREYVNKIKMKKLKPILGEITNKINNAESFEDIKNYRREKKRILNSNGISKKAYLYRMIPIVIHFLIIVGLFFALKYPQYSDPHTHSNFLWFNLTHSDLIVAVLAGICVFLNSVIATLSMTKLEKQGQKFALLFGPAVIIFWALVFPAAIGLYWIVNFSLLALQSLLLHMYCRKVYGKVN